MTAIPPDVLAAELVGSGSEPPPGMALKSATVTTVVGTAPDETWARIDGDSEPIPVQSLVGALGPDMRVKVLFWPPHGAYIVGLISLGEWVSVSSFGTNWGNLGGTSEVVQYRRDGNWVTLRGVANWSAGKSLQIFTLPDGYRPRARENFAVDANPQVHAVITPATNGDVEFVSATATAGYASVSGVRFWVE